MSNPLMRADRREGWRFLGGFTTGLAAAAATLLVPLVLLTTAVGMLDATIRGAALIVLLVGLGVADLLDRTPHVWRQVPQRFARELPPGRLGLIWAYDLGLLVTTQKTTSLLWIGLAGAVLTGPAPLTAVTAIVITVLFGLGVAVPTLMRGGAELTSPRLFRRIRHGWITGVRKASGLAALGLAAAEMVRLL